MIIDINDPRPNRLVFDIEANGLYHDVTKVHCIVAVDVATGKVFDYGPDRIREGLDKLASASQLIGNNILGYDVPALQKIYPDWQPPEDLVDTAVCSRCIWADIKERDFTLYKQGKIPGFIIGRHSLEAWGHRLGEYKGDFKGPWDTWTPEMHEYCIQDTKVTLKLYKKILQRVAKGYPVAPIKMDHDIQMILEAQSRFGFSFDERKAVELYAELASERDQLRREMVDMVPDWYVPDKEFTPKRDNKTQGYVAGVPLTKVKLLEFNPASDQHVASRLQKLYGWVPEVFTDAGNPKVDGDVMKTIDNPLAEKLRRFGLLNKRCEQIAEGKQAWLKQVRGGRVHHSCFASGTVTGRGAHAGPNLGQVPSGKKPYGTQCRELFRADPGGEWEMVGSDLSGIELRCLAHYLARWDGGEYARIILEGDIHWVNAQALGLAPEGVEFDKHNPDHEWARNGVAKTFILTA